MSILHFNDVYKLDEYPDEPVGGIARFVSAVRSFDHLDPLILFSGDLFAPSVLSQFFEGE